MSGENAQRMSQRDFGESTELPESLQERIEQALFNSPYYYLRFIHCQITENLVTLTGTVPLQSLARIAELIVTQQVREIPLLNKIQVTQPIRAMKLD